MLYSKDLCFQIDPQYASPHRLVSRETELAAVAWNPESYETNMIREYLILFRKNESKTTKDGIPNRLTSNSRMTDHKPP